MRNFKKYKNGAGIVEAVQMSSMPMATMDDFFDGYDHKYSFPDGRKLAMTFQSNGQEYFMQKGCWLIKDSNGTFYSCTPDVFEKEYTEVTDNN